MALRVHSPGTYSLLVDRGRPACRALGVPVGGAADRAAFALANALVGNPPEAAALEITLAGPTLEATARHGAVVWGAAFGLYLNDRPWPVGHTFTLRPGDVLTVTTAAQGLRAYLAVRGGFAAPAVLGSRSAFAPLKAGTELACPPSTLPVRYANLTPPPDEPGTLRVLPGSHRDLFPGAAAFTAEPYRVGPRSDRMGLRLVGPALSRPAGELLSAPVCPGTVQVTNDGLPLVLGVDAQTIGGYPRLAHVIAADLDRLAQLAPGAELRFRWADAAEARRRWDERQTWLRGWLLRLRASLDGVTSSPAPERT
jgi:antagonist of KipI